MNAAWALPIYAAAAAVLCFLARRRIGGLYAPPHGGQVLGTTWFAALTVSTAAATMAGSNPLAALAWFVAGPFAAIVATLLWREERNRARGLPDDYVDLPERLRLHHRIVCLVAALVMGGGAMFVASEGWRAAHAVLLLGGGSAGFGIAAVRGRMPERLRRRLGAELPAGHTGADGPAISGA